MNQEIIKIAVIGAGAVANEHHIPAWRKIPGSAVTAVVDVNRTTAEKTCARWKIARCYTDLAEMINSEKPTIVDICTPPHTHLQAVDQALSGGCSAIIEKPVSMDLDDSDRIYASYLTHKNLGGKLGVVYNWLFQPQIQTMIGLIKDGRIGDILNVEIKCLHASDEVMISNPNHWCHSLAGGRMGEVLIHPIYLLYKMMGDLKDPELKLTKRGPHSWVHYDELNAVYKTDRGFGNIYISFNSPRPEFPVISAYGTGGQITFNGHYMSLIIQTPGNSSKLFSRGLDTLDIVGQTSRSLLSNVAKTIYGKRRPNHELFFQLFIDDLRGKRNLPLTVEEAFRINRLYLELLDRFSEIDKASCETTGHHSTT